MQPDDTTVHDACSPAAASTDATTAGSSSGGVVFGIATTAVKPPSAAARAPVSTVSASSMPGSRRCTWRSTSPGATTQPDASSVSSPGEAGADVDDVAAADEHVGDALARRVDARDRPG